MLAVVVVAQGYASTDVTYDYMLSANALGIPKGNYGASYFVSPDLTLSAWTKMGTVNETAGTVYFDDKDGAGVQDEGASGSKEISGAGPAGDEALVFTFGTPVITDSPTLLLNKFNPDDSDVELVVTLHDGSVVTVPTMTVDTWATKLGKDSYSLAFADLPELVGHRARSPLWGWVCGVWLPACVSVTKGRFLQHDTASKTR